MNELNNPIEVALRSAATDPASRPDFYRLLVGSDVYVIGRTEGGEAGRHRVEPGEKISFQNWKKPDGSPVIPFFTSIEALQKSITSPAGYLAIPAQALFEITMGAVLVLNPGLGYGKEFHPEEIRAMLSGGVNRMPEQRTTQQETRVLLGQPKTLPTEMLNALSEFFRKRNAVQAAYLLLMHDVANEERPHLVVGIQADGDIELIVRDAGVVAADTGPRGESVDMFHIVPGEKGLSEYFLSTVKPFYQRG
jgi:hypothetical protein